MKQWTGKEEREGGKEDGREEGRERTTEEGLAGRSKD